MRRDEAAFSQWLLLFCNGRASLDCKVVAGVGSRERQLGDRAGRFDARRGRYSLEKLRVESRDLTVLRILTAQQCHSHRDKLLRIESGIDAVQPRETLNHQSCADQQDE